MEDFHRVTLLGVFVILKGHVKKDYLMWKRILKEENKEENKDCKPKVRMNMVTIDFHQQEWLMCVWWQIKRLGYF